MATHEELMKMFKDERILESGTTSKARDLNITTTLHYMDKLDPELPWDTMTMTQFKSLYSKLITSKDLKSSTIAIRSRYFLQFVRYLCEEKINTSIDLSELNRVKCHRPPAPVIKESEILSESQVADVLKITFEDGTTLPEWMRTTIALLFGAGMRISEVLRLKYGDVTYKFDNDSGRGYYRISVDDRKTDKRRTAFVNRPYLMEHIKKHISIITHDDNVNFLTGTDEEIHYSKVRYWFDKIRKCGYPDLTSHKGRKHNISRRIANSEPISTISLTTHGSINSSSLKHYLRLSEKDIVSNIMKFS